MRRMVPAMTPNPSLEARPNGKAPGPAPGEVYHPSAGPGTLPSAPPQLYVRRHTNPRPASMATIKRRGGAQIGWLSASWPLASIEIAPKKLTVSSMGSYTFSPVEVAGVEKVGSLPFISQGIRIHHTNRTYPERVIFYTLTGRDALVASIQAAGFSIGSPATQTARGFPLRVPAVLVVVVLWNILFFLDKPASLSGPWVPGKFVLLALALLFGLATLLPRSDRLQSVFMREDRDVGEISGALRLIQVVSGLMLIGFAASHFAQ